MYYIKYVTNTILNIFTFCFFYRNITKSENLYVLDTVVLIVFMYRYFLCLCVFTRRLKTPINDSHFHKSPDLWLKNTEKYVCNKRK